MKRNGAVNFVVHKVHAKNHPISIAEALVKMGYNHIEISEIFIEAGQSMDKLHQELVAANDFLPNLNENLESYFKEGNLKIFRGVILESTNTDLKSENQIFPKLLFPYPAPAPFVVNLMKKNKGISVTRHVFAFRLLYAFSMAVLGVIIAYVFIKLVEPTVIFNKQLNLNYWQNNLGSLKFMTALSIFVIFIVYVFQLFAQRLYNAGMSSWLTFLLLTPFLATITNLSQNDKKLVLILSCIPIFGLFIIAMLTPPHRYRL